MCVLLVLILCLAYTLDLEHDYIFFLLCGILRKGSDSLQARGCTISTLVFFSFKYAVGQVGHHYRYNNHIYQPVGFTFPAVSSIQIPILMIPVSIVLMGVVFTPL